MLCEPYLAVVIGISIAEHATYYSIVGAGSEDASDFGDGNFPAVILAKQSKIGHAASKYWKAILSFSWFR